MTKIIQTFKNIFSKRKKEHHLLKTKIVEYLKSLPHNEISTEQNDILRFLNNNALQSFPSDFTKKYNKNNIEVFIDSSNGLKYVIYENKRLYFKRRSSKRGIRRNFRNLLMEQDILSAHRYLTPDFDIEKNNIVFDIGAAEGNFTLAVIEKIEKAYLFETNPEWLEALDATFAPWKEKVVVVNKFVSDFDDPTTIALDTMFEKQPIDFLKIDVEGAELSVLKGAKKIIDNNKKLKIAVCAYHRQNDENILNDYLKSINFKTSTSSGFLIFTLDKDQKPPYLRRGLIRAEKFIG